MPDLKTLAGGVVAAALLAACGGEAKPTATATTAPGATTTAPATAGGDATDACALLADADVTAALGSAAKAEGSTSGKPLNQRLCTWSTATTPPKTFTINVTSTAGLDEAMRKNGMTAATMFESSKTAYAAQGTPAALPGVGDEAVRIGNQALVRKGDFFVTATTAFGDSADAIEVLVTLTTKAVAAL